MKWKYSNPVQIIFSDRLHDEINVIVENKKKILLICSNRFKKTGNFKKFESSIKTFETFSSIENNPSFDSCQKAITFAKDLHPDTIIAIGGGSVIDTAKAVRIAIYKSCYEIQKLFTDSYNYNSKPLFIAVPTTHGSGSELTMWATIWDKTDKKKYSLSEYNNYPDYAVYNVDLVKSLPIFISFSSTLDALSHSFEALWSKHSNPISDYFAMEAIKLIVNNLSKLVERAPIEVRRELLMASMYAGLAFSNTKTAAAHSISYPLSVHFNIPHGIACSMPLDSLLRINKKVIPDKISKFLDILQLSSISKLCDKVSGAIKNTKIPFTLHEYGVKRTDLEWILDLCFTKGRMDNNIVDLSKRDVLKILEKMY